MKYTVINGQLVRTDGISTAEGTLYDNSNSGLEADNAQDAIDETNAIKANKSNISNYILTGTKPSTALSSGTFFVDKDGALRVATDDIATTDDVGSGNSAVKSVGEVLSELNSNVNSTKIVKLFNTLQTSTVIAIPDDFKKYNRIDIKLYSTAGYSSVGSFFPSLEGDVYGNSNYSVSVFVFNNTDPDNSMQGYFYVTTNSGVIPYNLNLVLHDPASMFLGYQVFGCYNG